MDLTIRTGEGAGSDLCRWLAADPPVRGFGAAAVPAGREPGDGTMGTGFDLLNLIVPSVIALGDLLVSLGSFLDQRRRGTGSEPPISVAAGGIVIVVNGQPDTQALTAQIQAAVAQAAAAQAAAQAAAVPPAPAPAAIPAPPAVPPAVPAGPTGGNG